MSCCPSPWLAAPSPRAAPIRGAPRGRASCTRDCRQRCGAARIRPRAAPDGHAALTGSSRVALPPPALGFG
eukprot:4671682-Alexandrium_andersonii.AAC.1